MVDEMKKQMGRFEQLIGFKGTLDVTSNESMKELIKALRSKYKKDVQATLRLHRLEFFYDLVERKKNDEELKIEAKDIDDWKDLLTLSKIYYVLEHPRSEGLKWKRYITKKKTIDQFTDIDLIEWKVSQNFRLRGLEEWAQRRRDARRLAQVSGFLVDDDDDDIHDCKDLEELFHSTASKPQAEEKKKAERRPFKFQDECIEDWTESYSDDSECSDIEDFEEVIEDFPSELERELDEVEDLAEKEESISDLFSTYPKFPQYRESVFEEMDKAKTFEEWFPLYDKTRLQMEPEVKEEKPEEPSVKGGEEQEEDKKLPKIKEETEEVDDSKDSSVKADKETESKESTDNEIEDMEDDIEVVTDTNEEKVARPDEKAIAETATDASKEKVSGAEKEATEETATDASEEKVHFLGGAETAVIENEATDALEDKKASAGKEAIEETATDAAEEIVHFSGGAETAVIENETTDALEEKEADSEKGAIEEPATDAAEEIVARVLQKASEEIATDEAGSSKKIATGETEDTERAAKEKRNTSDDLENTEDEEDEEISLADSASAEF